MNKFVENIGKWIDYNGREVAVTLSAVFYYGVYLVPIIVAIIKLLDSNYLAAFLWLVLGSLVAWLASRWGTLLISYILQILFTIVRYIFYNVYTLLIFIVTVISVLIFAIC